MKKYKYEIIIFLLGAIYMILELVCSRVLAPYFGTSNLVWTSVIGVILLSSSVGNYIGGFIADKNASKKNIQLILGATGIFILAIALIQKFVLTNIADWLSDIRIGAIISTILLFFIPSMLIGFLSPIVIKIRMNDLSKVGKTSGILYSVNTLGSIVGTFLGGFVLIPLLGSIEILYILSICIFLIIIYVDFKDKESLIFAIIMIAINISLFGYLIYSNNINKQLVLDENSTAVADFDTEYGRVNIQNGELSGEKVRFLLIDKGNESATFLDEDLRNELVFEYTKFYDLMFDSNIEIKDTLMIGGAGYSYPKYYISHYEDKNMDVVEVDDRITEIAKEYFFLDDLYEDYDLYNNHRLNLITADGRSYLNSNTKKYDAILNDAFAGDTPAETLTTVEATQRVKDSLNEGGVYLSNIISSLDGDNSKFLKAEVATLKTVFNNVYIVPCFFTDDLYTVQNIMVVATDDTLQLDNIVDLNLDDSTIILTDNYSPIDSLIPII